MHHALYLISLRQDHSSRGNSQGTLTTRLSRNGAHGLDSSTVCSAGPSEVGKIVYKDEVNDATLGAALLENLPAELVCNRRQITSSSEHTLIRSRSSFSIPSTDQEKAPDGEKMWPRPRHSCRKGKLRRRVRALQVRPPQHRGCTQLASQSVLFIW